MPTLTVKNFACIKYACVEMAPITILIGPQASGKSLVSKLFYFFTDLIQNQYGYAERGEQIKPFLKSAAKRFSASFPPNAWGNEQFEVRYAASEIEFEIRRKVARRGGRSEVIVECSSFFEHQYTQLFLGYHQINRRSKDDDDLFTSTFSTEGWDLRRASTRALITSLEGEYIESQLFVPAGRSFFTNLGKAVAMLEFGSQLDDLTKRFGRLFTNLLDGRHRYFLHEKVSSRTRDFVKYQKSTMEAILGGTVKLGSADKHIETRDGRVIPLAMLSSGQQELLPLLLVLQHYIGHNAEDKDLSGDLLYIEEPEAHLFPSAQSALIDHLAAISNFLSIRSRLFITTHSPYVLAKLNNLVKAHEVASLSDLKAAHVAKLVPRQSWISSSSLNAYALDSGELRSIKDESGLIDGSYLDDISNDISATFMELLGLEVQHG